MTLGGSLLTCFLFDDLYIYSRVFNGLLDYGWERGGVKFCKSMVVLCLFMNTPGCGVWFHVCHIKIHAANSKFLLRLTVQSL